MDIDDILRDVDPQGRAIPADTREIQLLTRLWVAERSAPELLEWPKSSFFERLNERIKHQIEKVEDMTGDTDPKTNFKLVVIQTELERYKFLVRSYLRARMAKIDRHTLHYLSTPALQARLSAHELAYATRHQALLHEHYLASFLSALPQGLQNLNDATGNVGMVEKPDGEASVFIRLLADAEVKGKGPDADSTVGGKEGDVFLLRWEGARGLVEGGVAELI